MTHVRSGRAVALRCDSPSQLILLARAFGERLDWDAIASGDAVSPAMQVEFTELRRKMCGYAGI
jgi:hypothetical protein